MSTEVENRKDDTVIDSASISNLEKFNPDEELKFPVDLNIANMTVKKLKSLNWCHYQIPPKKLKLTNTGKTVVLSAKWNSERPFISGGPFSSRYVFSQVHFHWGRNDMEGSEHTIDGESLPMELHAVHFKSDYLSQSLALRKSDGISIVVNFFKLQTVENSMMNEIVKILPFVQQAHSSTRMIPWPMKNILGSFFDDYFLYRGTISTRNYDHSVLWLISRVPIGISIEQVAEFRKLYSSKMGGLRRDLRILHDNENRRIYHVNPSGSMYASLLPLSRKFLSTITESTRVCDDGDSDRSYTESEAAVKPQLQ